jgi:hypothetical protein
MRPERRAHDAPRLVLGLAILALGVLFTLDNVGVLDARRFLRYWPVVLIAVGFQRLFQGRDRSQRLPGLLLLLLGAWLLAGRFSLWPALLLILGAHLVWQALDRGRETLAEADSRVGLFAMMGGVSRKSVSQSFRGGWAMAVMGGVELDLREAALAGGEAAIETFALMGGVEIRVPAGWSVVLQGVPLMGGFEDNTKPQREEPQRLVVRGFAIMGGVEVKN